MGYLRVNPNETRLPRWPVRATCPYAASSSSRTSRRGGRESEAVKEMHPTPRKRLPRCKSTIRSAKLVGRSSMHPGHKGKRPRAAGTQSARAKKAIGLARASIARPTTLRTPSAPAKPGAGRNALPGRLSPSMACDTAFRIIARRHLGAFLAQHDSTCRGDPEALHQIRIALTHLRTAIRFFSPIVDDALRPNVWAELKWLNSQL